MTSLSVEVVLLRISQGKFVSRDWAAGRAEDSDVFGILEADFGRGEEARLRNVGGSPKTRAGKGREKWLIVNC